MYAATKVVIIAERVILDGVCDLLEAHGATGYTYMSAGGKGSRGVRRQNRAQVSSVSSNVKIEAIVADAEQAAAISEAVAAKYFDHYSGITYLQPVEIVRRHKFLKAASADTDS